MERPPEVVGTGDGETLMAVHDFGCDWKSVHPLLGGWLRRCKPAVGRSARFATLRRESDAAPTAGRCTMGNRSSAPEQLLSPCVGESRRVALFNFSVRVLEARWIVKVRPGDRVLSRCLYYRFRLFRLSPTIRSGRVL